jgi:hypothetical protein
MNALTVPKAQSQDISLSTPLRRALTRDELEHEVMLRRGIMSATKIADVVGNGMTRNSVIGIWHRVRLRRGLPALTAPAPAKKPTPTKTKSVAEQPKTKPARTAAEPVRLPAPPTKPAATASTTPPHDDGFTPLRVRIYEIADDGCRFILGDPVANGETLYCGLKATKNAYCAHHAQMSYQKLAKRSEKKDASAAKKPGMKPSAFSLRGI